MTYQWWRFVGRKGCQRRRTITGERSWRREALRPRAIRRYRRPAAFVENRAPAFEEEAPLELVFSSPPLFRVSRGDVNEVVAHLKVFSIMLTLPSSLRIFIYS